MRGLLVIPVIGAAMLAFAQTKPVVPTGTYRGLSLCLEKSCYDQKTPVIYHIAAVPKKKDQFTIQEDKLVKGRPESMASYLCTVVKPGILRCDTADLDIVVSVDSKLLNLHVKRKGGDAIRTSAADRVR